MKEIPVHQLWDQSIHGGDSDVLLIPEYKSDTGESMSIVLKDYVGLTTKQILDYHKLQNELSKGYISFALSELIHVFPYGRVDSILVRVLELGEYISSQSVRSFVPGVEGRDLMILPEEIVKQIIFGIGVLFEKIISGFDYTQHGHFIHPANFRVVLCENRTLGIVMTDISSSVKAIVNLDS